MRLKLMAVVATVSFAVPAISQIAETPASAPAPVKEKKICRRTEVTGSFIGSKAVCHTKTEWTAIDNANGDAASNAIQRQRDTRPNRPEM